MPASFRFIEEADRLDTERFPQESAPLTENPIKVPKLGHIVFHVRDLERSIRFYTDVLNFRVSDRVPGPQFKGMTMLNGCGDHTIALMQADAGEDAQQPEES